MSFLKSLNRFVPWNLALEVLGSPTVQMPLPARAGCPLCGGSLSVYQDTSLEGQWHYCFGCRHAGDMIDLATAVWAVPHATACRRLFDHGISVPEKYGRPEGVEQYIKCYPETRKRFDDFWRRSRVYLAESTRPELNGLRRRACLTVHYDRDRWDAGPGRSVGAAYHSAVEQVFVPGTRVVGRDSAGEMRIFIGRGWSDVLVFPFHDLPGRICSWLFVGRSTEAADQVIRPAARFTRHRGSFTEGGLSGYWAIEESGKRFNNHIAACDDALFVARLQARHFATSNQPLPLVAYQDGNGVRTGNVWKNLPGRIPVFWGWRLTASMLFQAMQCNGKLALTPLAGTSRDRINHYVRDNAPEDIVERAISRATHWPELFAQWCETAATEEVSELLTQMQGYGVSAHQLAAISPKVRNLGHADSVSQTVTIGKYTVVEKDSQWWSHPVRKSYREGPAMRLVMNAALRIDGTYLSRKDQSLHYRGRLIHGGDVMPFEAKATALRERPDDTLTAVLAKSKPGLFVFVEPDWGTRIINAGELFAGIP